MIWARPSRCASLRMIRLRRRRWSNGNSPPRKLPRYRWHLGCIVSKSASDVVADRGTGGTFLAGMRVSSSLMNGVSWAMGNAGLFLTVQDITLLDAQLSFNVSWAMRNDPPVMTVPSVDRMDFEWSDGYVRVECHSMPQKVDMLDFKWTELLGNGTFNHSLGGCNEYNAAGCECTGVPQQEVPCGGHDKCENFPNRDGCLAAAPPGRCVWSQSASARGRCIPNTCAFPQVTWFDTTRSELELVAPRLPVPDALLDAAMQSALQSGKGQLNEELEDNAMCLPLGVANYLVPPPAVTMYPQHTDSHPGHGFLELVSFCGGSEGRQRCLRGHSHARSGNGGTDCLSQASLLTTEPTVSTACMESMEALGTAPACGPGAACRAQMSNLTTEVGRKCAARSEDSRAEASESSQASGSDSYFDANGNEYVYGSYTIAKMDHCLESCAGAPKGPGGESLCLETRFQNGRCSEFSIRTCRGDVYVEEQYGNANCTGKILNSHELREGRCQRAEMMGLNMSMQVRCPQLIVRPPPPTPLPLAAQICIWALVVAVAATGCAVGLRRVWLRHNGAEAAAAAFSSAAEGTRACCMRSAEIARPAPAACGRCCARSQRVGEAAAGTCAVFWRRIAEQAVKVFEVLSALTFHPKHHFGIHDWVQVALMLATAFGFGLHALLWYLDDPFDAFNRDIVGAVGLDNSGGVEVDAAPMQTRFSLWSSVGLWCTIVSSLLVLVATGIGMADQLPSKGRNALWMMTLALVMFMQVCVMLAPPFFFQFRLELKYNPAHSFTSEPVTKHEADDALSLAFDGIALTFVSALFLFLLHGVAPGVFLGSCCFCSHIFSLSDDLQRKRRARPAPPPPTAASNVLRQSLLPEGSGRWQGLSSDSVRLTMNFGFTTVSHEGTWLAPRRARVPVSDRVLAQQQPRVRILNWLATLGAPCGGSLPAIIVYQSLGCEFWWALMWPCCWVLPAFLMAPLASALHSRGRPGEALLLSNRSTALAYIVLYACITVAILIGLLLEAQAGGFSQFSVSFPATMFLSSALGTSSLTLAYLERSMLVDATREHIGQDLSSVVLASTRAVQRAQTDGDEPAAPSALGSTRSRFRGCLLHVWHWLLERDEHLEPQRFGRRLPSRRGSLILGLGLCSWVQVETFRENDGFADSFVLDNVKELLADLDLGVQWPEGNATVLDEAFKTYGEHAPQQTIFLDDGCVSL